MHYQYGLVRLVPETGIALIRENQVLTDIQKDLLTKADYTIEMY